MKTNDVRRVGLDVPLYDAMLCWDTDADRAGIVLHPDRRGLSDAYDATAGACYTNWRKRDETARRLQFMIDAWHAVAFNGVSAETMHEALLVVPEYRDMLADDVLPRWARAEREGN